MIARLLNQCGLSLGPEDELLPPNEFNTEGYWENEQFVKINDELLAHFGGGWDVAPNFPEGWEHCAELDSLRRRAEELVTRFARYEPWGWKDPRSSLTIPFWRTIMPDLRVLICVRNPLEVVVSLTKRANCSDAFGLSLWLQYNRRALTDSMGLDYAVTHYDTYYQDAPGELRRVIDALGLTASDEVIAHACASIRSGVRHHKVGKQDVSDAGVSEELQECYTRLLELGEVKGSLREYGADGADTTQVVTADDTAAWRSSYPAMRLVRLEAEVQLLRNYAVLKTQETERANKEKLMLTEMVTRQQELIEGLNLRLQTLSERRELYQQMGQQLAEKERQAAGLASRVAELEKQVGWYQAQLNAVKATIFYKLGTVYWNLHSRLRGGG